MGGAGLGGCRFRNSTRARPVLSANALLAPVVARQRAKRLARRLCKCGAMLPSASIQLRPILLRHAAAVRLGSSGLLRDSAAEAKIVTAAILVPARQFQPPIMRCRARRLDHKIKIIHSFSLFQGHFEQARRWLADRRNSSMEAFHMALSMAPGRVLLTDLADVFWNGTPVVVAAEFHPAIERSARRIAEIAAGNEPVYGVNTGFGKLASIRIDAADSATLQRNLVLSHCCGFGAPLAEPIVRLILTLKLISLGRGASGVRPELIGLVEAMLERGVIPHIPEKGSVGASGDLAPLAHLAAVMIGEGQAYFAGETVAGRVALHRAGLSPIVLCAKEGLALVNGTQVSTALALAGLFRAHRALQASIVTGAMSVDAAMASSAPFHPEIQSLRGHRGQMDVGGALRQLLDGSTIRESHREGDARVQDPYCLRCQPQVVGACLDILRQVAATLRIEANAVTDNPLVLSDNSVVSGGNFHAEPVAFAADHLALAICEIGAIAQRRIALLVDPALSFGLPAFLAAKPGLNSGYMIAEVTSAALMAENKQMSHPASVDSTPTSANQEDHVSMACHGARRLLAMTDNLFGILGIEALCAVQGIEFRRPLTTSPDLEAVVAAVRSSVAALEQDRFMAGDIETAANFVRDGLLIHAVSRQILPELQA